MIESVEALEKFINDFSLKELNGIASFSATINIRLNSHLQILNSNIQIITSSNLATVYLTDLGKKDNYVPEMLEANKYFFIYKKAESLQISGMCNSGNFCISIFPKEK